jgi:hypothetical protein
MKSPADILDDCIEATPGIASLPESYRMVLLNKENAYDMHMLQNAVVENAAFLKNASFLTSRDLGDFESHFDSGHRAIGCMDRGRLIAHSLFLLPTKQDPETGLYGMRIDCPIEKVGVIAGTVVHPEYQGRGLQAVFTSLRMRMLAKDKRNCVISDIASDNIASWRSLMSSGLHIDQIGGDPKISSQTIYFMKANITSLKKGILIKAFNVKSQIPVAMQDIDRQKNLSAKGYRGVKYNAADKAILFVK